MSNKFYGIIQDQSGRYITASLTYNDSREFEKPQFSNTETINFKDELLWADNGIVFGIPVKYQPANSKLVYEHFDSSLKRDESCLKALANHADLKFGAELLEANLVKITGEDSFLTTIPLYLSDYNEKSFVSIYFDTDYSLISITINSEQKAVFKYNSENSEDIIGFLGRIERYWKLNFTDTQFPEMVIFINRNDSPELLPLKPHFINNEWLLSLSLDQIRALGLALCQKGENTPVFQKSSKRADFRKTRHFINIASFSILVVSLLVALLFFLFSKYENYKLSSLKKDYARIIASDAEVKELNKRNKELAATILYMESNISKRTRWAEFLYLLGKGVPKELFVEKLGSEPVKGADNQIKIALLGFASQEISITKLIALLQKTPYITKVSLVSMEKDKKSRDKYRFKVICTLLSDK